MVRALGRPALPVLLALALSPAADGGPISVAENPGETTGTSALYGNVVVRIASGSFESNASFDYESVGTAAPATAVSALTTGPSLTAPGGASAPRAALPEPDLPLAGSSIITVGNNTIDVRYFTGGGFTGGGAVAVGAGDASEAAPNPEPPAIALFCLGGIGLAVYAWRVRRRQCA